MTTEQFDNCKQCLNRKKGVSEEENICNLKGKNIEFEDTCKDFAFDNDIVLGFQNKINAIKPNLQRANRAQLLIWLVSAVDIISVYSFYLQYKLLCSLQNNEYVSNQTINTNDTRVRIIGILYLIVFFISAFTFIQWFRRAYYNLNIRANCNHSESWAAGSWFVPIISFFRPYQIMKEMHHKTTALIKSNTDEILDNSNSGIGVWWGLWIITNYFGNYILKSSFKAETIEDYLNNTIAQIVISIFGILLAVITVMMIKSYSLKEEKISELEKRKKTPENLD